MKEEVSFRRFLKKDDPKLPRKRKVSSHYEEEEAPIEFASQVEEYLQEGGGGQIPPPRLEKTILKKPSLIRVKSVA